jgi:membrane associated rhomboid family serine protease
MVMPLTPAVKGLIIANVAIWFVLQLILEEWILREPLVTLYLGLVPELFLKHFLAWQPITYMFLHSANPFHILFNMIMLWWLGSELEQRWGSRFFLIYYFASGIGAGLIYAFGLLLASLFSASAPSALSIPVVGASGAIFGLLLAYGMIFGERIVSFMMLFPMRAKYFVMILGAVEVATLLNNGHSNVANLAHIGGLLAGYLFLQGYTRLQQGRWRKKGSKRGGGGRGLRLVVNNKKDEEKDGPRYWN